jgi:hypothetical protein
VIDEIKYARSIALWRELFRRAWDDLNALLYGGELPGVEEAERAELLAETLDWFLNPAPSPVCLDVVCSHLSLDADVERRKAHDLAHGRTRIKLRKSRLTREQIEAIRIALDAGETTRQIGARFKIDPATVRKHRIKFRRAAA